jgi:hypothetical protein
MDRAGLELRRSQQNFEEKLRLNALQDDKL